MPDIKLWHGDCLELMKRIPDGSVDLVLTDPPYKLIAGGRRGKSQRGIFSENEINTQKGKLFEFNDIKFSDWIGTLKTKLKNKSHILIFCNGRNLKDLLIECDKFYTFKNILVWNKSNKTPSRNYMQQVEYIVMYSKGKCKGINDMGSSNLLDFKNIIGIKKHPTEKPTNLLKHLIGNSTKKGELIIDPFMGSGSTGVAAKNLNRNFIGIELDESYFKIAQERIADA